MPSTKNNKFTREELTPQEIHHLALAEIAAEREVKNALTTHFPLWVKKHRKETDFHGTLRFALMLAHHANDDYNPFRVNPYGFFVYRYRDVSPTVVFTHYRQSALTEMHQLLCRNVLEKMPEIGKKTELIAAVDVGPQLKDVALLVDITHPHVRATFIAACKFQQREFATTTWCGPLPESTHWEIEVDPNPREPPRTSVLPIEQLEPDPHDDNRVIIEPTIQSVYFHERHGPLGPRWQDKNW